ncbi:MAG: hypothetical protein GF383_06855 [Candidatus Lokiarchaeota archaeon]|nr:hypothetical protein [Candidatus Lokiarchaeota archaeon]
MQVNENSLREILEYFRSEPLISVSGKAGTGKTSLVLFILSKLVSSNETCLWLQTSESFQVRRAKQFASADNSTKDSFLNYIFVVPRKVCSSYSQQAIVLRNFMTNPSLESLGLKYMVIDNISSLLRFELTRRKTIEEKVLLMNSFFSDSIFPMVMFCQRIDINLILIHEATFVPGIGKTHKFFHKTFDKLDFLDVNLSKVWGANYNVLQISDVRQKWSYKYKIGFPGFEFF